MELPNNATKLKGYFVTVPKFKEFNTKDAQTTGGVTGSVRVTRKVGNKKFFYQLKPSILANTFFRRLKAGSTDRENFGEVIAAKIGRGMLQNPDGSEAVPDVSLAYDKTNKKVSVASKYLTGAKVRTLDVYAKEQKPKIEFKKHATFVDGTKPLSPGQYDISGDAHKKFRQGLARAIAVSALVGDHDVNPGNMMAVDDKVARIDFGHAFNDLLNTSKIFGGRVRNKNNQMLDFLNRENIASFPPPGTIPKLWRDYPSMVPSQELADAFKEMSQSNGMAQGIDAARTEFEELIIPLEETKDLETQKHVLKSLKTINNAIEGEKISTKLPLNEAVKKVFSNIEKFCDKNKQQMLGVSKLMQLQIDIDKMMKSAKTVDPTEEQMSKIKQQYAEMTKDKSIGAKNKKSIQWVKTSANKKAFKGDLQSYIKERSKELGLGKKLGKKVAHDKFKLPKKHNLFRRILNAISYGNKETIATASVSTVQNPELLAPNPVNHRVSVNHMAKQKVTTPNLETIIATAIITEHALFKDNTRISKNNFIAAIESSQSLDSSDRKSFTSLASKMDDKTYSKDDITKLVASV